MQNSLLVHKHLIIRAEAIKPPTNEKKLTHKKIHSIEERVKRLEKILLTCTGALIAGMAFLIYTLVSHITF